MLINVMLIKYETCIGPSKRIFSDKLLGEKGAIGQFSIGLVGDEIGSLSRSVSSV